MGFETGMALGQQIGSAMGAQSSEFAESLVKQKFASDMNLRSSTLTHASKNGLGVNVSEDGVSLNPYIYGGAPDQVKALAISQYRKQEQEAMEKQSEATIKQLKTVNELFSQFDKHKDSPGLRKAYGNMINEVVSKPEINGAPNPLRWVGKLLSEDGQFDMLQVMAGNQNYKDLKAQSALLVHQGFVDSARKGDLPAMREHLSVLRGMSADDPELLKNMGIDVSKSFSEYQQAFETQAEKAAREMREAERKAVASRDTSLENKIKTIMKANPGMSYQDATNYATGLSGRTTDPLTGETSRFDLTKKTLEPLQTVQRESAEPTEDPSINLFNLAQKATGPTSAVKQAFSVFSGAVGGPIAEETVESRQTLEAAQNDLVRALSINPRFPVGEIKRIQEEINIKPTFFDNPKMMRGRMKSISGYLESRLKREREAMKNPKLNVKQRQGAAQAAKDIGNFLKILGVPPTVESEDAYKKLPKGATYFAPDGKLYRKE